MNKPFLPQGAEVGADGVHYRIWAPVGESLELEVYEPGGEVIRRMPLSQGHGGYFHGRDELGRAGDLYKFRLNGAQSFPDPASRFQPQGVHGPSMVIDPRSYVWADSGWVAPDLRDLVIYELHVGTFTPGGTFRSAIEKLVHVRGLGATTIEIMPVADFAGERNWGYDGVCLYAPAHAYGEPDDFRALVDAAHGLGLAVMLDVVYNHFGPDGNYLGCYIGEYLDESKKTPWGGAIRYGHPEFRPLREMVVANPAYWMREFHIDGFRLDATHAIMDESERHILKEITGSIHELGGFAVAEDPRNEARIVLPEEEGGYGFDGVWADDFHHTVRVSNTHEQEAYLANFTGSLTEVLDTIRHGWFYRGQPSKTQREPRGTECRHIAPRKFIHCISNHDQTGNHAFGKRLSDLISPEAYRTASALLCLMPYTPMLFMGQEWAASTPFLFFTDHNEELGKLIAEGRREEFKDFEAFKDPERRSQIPNPQSVATFESSKLQWNEVESGEMRRILELYRVCLAMRTGEPAFRPASREMCNLAELACGVGALRCQAGASEWLVLFDLVGGHGGSLEGESICALPPGASWSLILSTAEERFGGKGQSAVSEDCKTVRFDRPELVVLRAGPESRG